MACRVLTEGASALPGDLAADADRPMPTHARRGAALNAAGIFRFLAKPWGRARAAREVLERGAGAAQRLLATRRALRAALPGEELSIRRRLTAGELRKLANA